MSGRQFWKRTALVSVVAAVINVGVYVIAKTAGVELLVPQGATPTALGVAPVILFTIVPLVLAAVLLLVLRRVGVTNPRVFAGIVIVVTLLSLAAPLSAALTTSNKLSLAIMHVIAGLAALVGLTPLSRGANAPAPTGSVSTA